MMETHDIDIAELKRFGILLACFFILTPLTLFATIASLLTVSEAKEIPAEPTSSVRILASLPEKKISEVSVAAHGADARVELVRQYLARYESPLAPLATHIVETADKNGLDFRLIPAIAQQESNLCKKIPEGSFNCWGWGIHKRGTLGFSSYEETIEVVSVGLKTEYINKGYVTPDEIMRKYTPSSPGTWAAGVNEFIAQME